jgi:hypothetical protein
MFRLLIKRGKSITVAGRIQKKVLTENKEEDLLQMIASLNQYS